MEDMIVKLVVAWDRSERKLLRELERGGKGKLAIL